MRENSVRMLNAYIVLFNEFFKRHFALKVNASFVKIGRKKQSHASKEQLIAVCHLFSTSEFSLNLLRNTSHYFRSPRLMKSFSTIKVE